MKKGLQARLAAVRRLNRAGVADRQVAEQLGVHVSTVARARHRLGLPGKGRTALTAPRRWNPGRDAIALYQQGLNDREIAERLGVARETVTAWRRRQGLRAVGRRGPRKRT